MTSNEWRDEVYGYALSLRETLAEVWDAIDAGEDYEGEDASEYLAEMPLEIVWEHGEPFSVLLTFGGPTAEITGGGRSGGYVLTVSWGETVELRGDAITRTGEHFRELVETD